MSVPRGIRNFNPGNIEYGAFTKSRGAVGSDGRFAIAPDMATGCGWIASLLIVYYDKKLPNQIDTVEEAIGRWAPSNENNTKAYVAAVCHELECEPEDRFDFRNVDFLYWMICAMGEHENGVGHDAFLQYVPDADIDAGIAKALT